MRCGPPRRRRPRFDAEETNGRKRHIAVDSNGLVLAIVVTVAAIRTARRSGCSPHCAPRSPPSPWYGPIEATPGAS
jgi:hypothetical protein